MSSTSPLGQVLEFAAPERRTPHCKSCGRAPRDGADLCTWWPPSCPLTGRTPARRPTHCWECLDEDQQSDLVDAGCPTAASRRIFGR